MKTLQITNSWSPTSGGIATFHRALAEAANGRGQSMSLVFPGPINGERTIGDFVRLYEIASPRSNFNSAYRTIYPSQFLTSGGRLREILKAEKPDLIEIKDKYTLIDLGPPIRLRLLHDFDFRPAVAGLSCERMDVNFQTHFSAGAFGRAFYAWYMRNVYSPFFDYHIAISDPTAGELRNAGKGNEVARGLFQWPHGADCSVFSPVHRSASERSELLHRIDAGESTALLLYFGPLAPEKNLSLLIETMEALPSEKREYRLIIAGAACPVVPFSDTQSNAWAREPLGWDA